MVGSQHEAMHRIFQHDPGMFTRAFRDLGLSFDDPLEVALLPTDLTETRPVERRVDTLLRITTATGAFLLLVEAQGREDSRKPGAWAYYLAHLHAKYELPPVLLVVCNDRTTAQWASGQMAIGLPQWPSLTVHPLVLGPDNVPVVTDVVTAAADVPLAALSAITHVKDPLIDAILKTLADALLGIEKDDRALLIELTELGLGGSPARDTWRQLMSVPLDYFRSETSQRLRAEGAAERFAEIVLRTLKHRDISVSDEVRARVMSCVDEDVLGVWFERALTASVADDLFVDDHV